MDASVSSAGSGQSPNPRQSEPLPHETRRDDSSFALGSWTTLLLLHPIYFPCRRLRVASEKIQYGHHTRMGIGKGKSNSILYIPGEKKKTKKRTHLKTKSTRIKKGKKEKRKPMRISRIFRTADASIFPETQSGKFCVYWGE